MKSFKRDRFRQMHPNGVFPHIQPVGPARVRELRMRLAEAVGFPREVDNLALTHHIDSILRPLEGVSAEEVRFDLSETIRSVGIAPLERVYVNWYRYDDIDEIALANLSLYFSAIWYPSSDDIEVFDETCKWIVAVSHYGAVAYARFP